jgi:hypothetical protein
MGVCQWEHLHESLHDCVSCTVYIFLDLKLFHYGCVSVRASVWKVAWLCILSCIYCLESKVISLWVCVSESIWMKGCMIAYLVLYILSWVLSYFIMGVCQWEHLYESLHDCVSCPVYTVLSRVLSYFIMGVCQWEHLYESLYDCVSCPVYIVLSRVLSYFIMGVCQWEHLYERLHDCVSGPVYIVLSLKLFHYGCVSVRAYIWKLVWLCVLSCIYCLES